MTTILVPIDFSDASRNAALYAAGLAKQMDGSLLLCHVYTMPVMVSPDMAGTVMVDIGQLEKDFAKLLHEEAQYIQKHSGVNATYKLLEGFAAGGILALEKEQQPVLIVMGLKTAGTFSELVFGSTATDILSEVHTPVIIVPEAAVFKKVEKLAFADDYKTEPGTLMHRAVNELLVKSDASVFILNVVKPNEPLELDKLKGGSIEKYFETVPCSYHQVENNDVVDGINEFVNLHKIDMVAMIPHKHGFFARLFSEGNTKKFAFHTHIPLLALPEAKR